LLGDFGPVVSEASGETIQGALQVRVDLRLRVEPTRKFRDGSYGRLIYVDGASLERVNESEDVPVANDLVGRTVELRTFSDGEILDISWIEKLAGQGRYLDAFEVIFPAISPSAPTISEGETVKQRIIWPFRNANEMRWDNTIDAVWSNHGTVQVGEVDAWKLSYEGAWGTEGKTRRSVPSQEWRARGESKGTVHYERKTSDLIEHHLEWHRLVSVEGAGDTLNQEQRFEGHVERLP